MVGTDRGGVLIGDPDAARFVADSYSRAAEKREIVEVIRAFL